MNFPKAACADTPLMLDPPIFSSRMMSTPNRSAAAARPLRVQGDR